MKKLSFVSMAVICLFAIAFTACEKEQIVEPTPSTVEASDVQASHLPDGVVGEYYTPSPQDFATPRSGNFTVVPGGSVDALADAIDDTQAGGVVYLQAGTHTLNSRLTITKSVKIIGEDGAVISVSSEIVDPTVVNPGIHVLDAPATLIKNVAINPIQDSGSCGVMLENSPNSAVLDSEISKFDLGILVEFSDRVALIGNTISESALNGILVANGKSAYVGNNIIENGADIGLWSCDEWGTAENNIFRANPVGVLTCNFPGFAGVTLPSGATLDALLTCTGWKFRNNQFVDNENIGLAIRDASHWNLFESNNSYSGNGIYDIIIPAYVDVVPGVFDIPAAYNNTIHAAPDVLIKDCGINTTIFGGTLVDTNEDPC